MKYLVKNILIFFVMTVLIFLIVRMIPISPVEMLLQKYNLPLTEENKLFLIKEYGLDKSLFSQYLLWIKELLKGNFGYSLITKLSIREEFIKKAPYSLMIGMGSLFISIILSFFLGFLSSLKENGILDKFTRLLSIFSLSFPSFIVSIFIIYYFGVKFRLIKFFSGSNFWGIFFSILILVLYQSASLTRIARKSFINLKKETYVKFYLIRGYNLKYILLRHCYKPVLYSILSASLAKFSTVIGGSVVVEFAFAIPGISYFLINSIVARDYNVIQAYLIVLFVWMILVHLIIDFLLLFFKEKSSQ